MNGFYPEHSLPPGKDWFSPRWLAKHWGRSIQHVLNLIDSGDIQDWVDMRGKGSRRSNANIPRQAVVDFLNRRKNSELSSEIPTPKKPPHEKPKT